MKKGVEKVSLVHCKGYEQSKVDRAVEKAFEMATIEVPSRKKVLIKPNVVGDFKCNQEAITTHPSVVEAVCKLLKKNNCEILIGDSSFTNPENAFKKSGLEKVAKKYGKLVIFDQQKMTKIRDGDARVLKSFHVPETLKKVDVIIDIPKLKTHSLTKYTGALKNLYGCIPGGMKQTLHGKAPNEKKFSSLLIDIYQNILPTINLMDGIIGMEGKGPTAGNPIKSGVILASKSSVSLDVACSKLIGYNPKKILAIKEAVKRELGSFKIDFVSDKKGEKIPNLKFEKPVVKYKLSKSLKKIFREKPIVVYEDKCVKCGLCARKCPRGAITLKPFPVIDRKKCIRCFCCIEVCPQHALYLKD